MAVLERARSRRGRRVGPLTVALIVMLAAGAAALAWLGGDEEGPGGSQPALVTGEEIADHPARYLRRDVTITGEITDVVGPSSYVVGPASGPEGDGVLVVSRSPRAIPQAQRPLLENDSVQITGEVRTFRKQRFQRELGRQLEDDLAGREGDPVVLADRINVVPSLLPIGEEASLGDIVSRPRDFLGTIVSVEGRVTDSFERGALVLSGRTVVLLPRTTEVIPGRGERIRVTGAVRRYDLDELTARTRDDVDDDLFGDLVERPAIVAYAIERNVGRSP